MEKPLKKITGLPMRGRFLRISTMALILAGFVFPASPAFAIYVQYFSATPSTVSAGQLSMIRAHCQDQDSYRIYTFQVPAPQQMGFGAPYPEGYIFTGGGEDVTQYVTPSATTQYWLACRDNRVSDYAHAYAGPVTVTVSAALPPDNCPTGAVLMSNGFSVGPGVRNVKGTISGIAYNFCLNNQTAQTFFVPLSTPAEYNAFIAAAQGRLSASIAYFTRTAGY